MAFDSAAIDSDVAKVRKQLLRAILALDELEQVRGVVDELQRWTLVQVKGLEPKDRTVVHVLPPMKTSCVRRRNRNGMLVSKCTSELCPVITDRKIYLDTANTELDESAEHLPPRDFIGRAAHSDLHEQTIIVRLPQTNFISQKEQNPLNTHRNLCARKARARIEPDPIPTRTAIHLDLARVRLEIRSRILSRHTALYREPALLNHVLAQAQLGQGRSGGDLNLGRDNVDACDFLCSKITQGGSALESQNTEMGGKHVPVMVCSTWMRGLISMK